MLTLLAYDGPILILMAVHLIRCNHICKLEVVFQDDMNLVCLIRKEVVGFIILES